MNPTVLVRKGLNRLRSPIILRQLLKSQYLSPDELNHLRIARLKDVVHTALNTVPFYKSLQKDVDFSRFSIDVLKQFPIVTKEKIRQSPEQFISSEWRRHFAHSYRTSGSSGNRFRFLVPFWSSAYEEAFASRAWGMNSSYEYQQRDPVVFLRTYAPKVGEALFRRDPIQNYTYLSPFDIKQENLELYLKVIRESGAKLLRAYPSSLYLFTLLLKEDGVQLPQIKTLVTASETLLPQYRKTIQEYWQIPVLDWYGQNERTVTIQQCEFGTYHNNDEYGIVEFDSDSQIIATSLINNVMPFIRYATGDYAAINETPGRKCQCGRSLSSPVTRIDGRSDDLLAKPDGTLLPTINIYTAMEKFESVRQFSLLQTADKSIHMKIVMNESQDSEYFENIRVAIQQRVGQLPIDIELVGDLERDLKTEKFRAIRSEVPQNKV